MSEQQYRVVADRDKGDKMPARTEVGDRITQIVGEDRNDLIRIERPVPTTDEPRSAGVERLAEVLFDAEHGNGAWWDYTGDAIDPYMDRARYVIERLAELSEADRD